MMLRWDHLFYAAIDEQVWTVSLYSVTRQVYIVHSSRAPPIQFYNVTFLRRKKCLVGSLGSENVCVLKVSSVPVTAGNWHCLMTGRKNKACHTYSAHCHMYTERMIKYWLLRNCKHTVLLVWNLILQRSQILDIGHYGRSSMQSNSSHMGWNWSNPLKRFLESISKSKRRIWIWKSKLPTTEMSSKLIKSKVAVWDNLDFWNGKLNDADATLAESWIIQSWQKPHVTLLATDRATEQKISRKKWQTRCWLERTKKFPKICDDIS